MTQACRNRLLVFQVQRYYKMRGWFPSGIKSFYSPISISTGAKQIFVVLTDYVSVNSKLKYINKDLKGALINL